MNAVRSHCVQILAAGQPAFGDEGAALGSMGHQLIGSLEIDGEVPEIAVVHPDQPRLQPCGALHLGGVVHLDQGVHAAFDRGGLYLLHLGVVQGGDDDQDGVSPQRARFVHLPGVDHEVLAQHRDRYRPARLFQEHVRPLEPALVGQDRQAGGTARFIGAGMSRGIEIGADQALGGAGLLHLGDQRMAGLGIQRGTESARRGDGGDLGVQIGMRHGRLARRDIGTLGFQDAVEHRHR